MNILITGASGFVGRYLLEHLLEQPKVKLYGTSFHHQSSALPKPIRDSVTWLSGDLQEQAFVQKCLDVSQPDQVYHLAAFASAGDSFKNPSKTIINNIQAQILLLESLRQQKSGARTLIVGSIDVYGMVEGKANVTEETALRPVSPYGVSKITQDFLGLQYFLSYQLPIVRVRPSNHIGPGQGPGYVLPAFCRQIARIEKGLQEPRIQVGNLAGIRDFTDVRDMVKAYVLALNLGDPGEAYVIGSGNGQVIEEVLQRLIRLSSVKIEIQQDANLMRPLDIPRIVVDASKFMQKSGWQPTIPFDETLSDLLNYWREADKELLQ